MTQQLAGKVAVITGAASGVGAATARAFVAAGAAVVLADLNEQKGAALAQTLDRARFMRVDVSSEAQVAAAIAHAVKHFGRLDIMVNNAGLIGATGSIRELSEQSWRATLAVLLDSVFFGTKHAADAMIPQRSGCILSVSSIAGVMGGHGPHAYTAAKHAVVGLTRSVASELSAHRIRVNSVAPGPTLTGITAAVVGSVDAASAVLAQASPFGAPIMPEDIAGALLYLASDAGRYVTGQTLTVDAGLTECGAVTPPYHSGTPGFLGPRPSGAQDQ